MDRNILAAIIGAVGIITASLITIYLSNPGKRSDDRPKVITGRVTEGNTSNPISQAEVTIVGRNESDYSDDNGNFRILIDDDKITIIKVIIRKNGYKPVNLSFNLPDENVQIRMMRGN